MSNSEIVALEQEIRELEDMLKTFVLNPAYGRTMSMSRWGRERASWDGIESELTVARNRLAAWDPGNPLADGRRTNQIKEIPGSHFSQRPQSVSASSSSGYDIGEVIHFVVRWIIPIAAAFALVAPHAADWGGSIVVTIFFAGIVAWVLWHIVGFILKLFNLL